MHFESFSDFIHMGGHGIYVWLCYLLGLVVIAGNLIGPVLKRKSLTKNLIRRLRREEKV